MLLTTLTAFVFFAAVQCLLVVHVADKLSPSAAEDRSTQRPADSQARYA